MMTLHIPEIRAIRLFVPFVIPYANFITNYAFGRMTRILTGYFLASPLCRSTAVHQDMVTAWMWISNMIQTASGTARILAAQVQDGKLLHIPAADDLIEVKKQWIYEQKVSLLWHVS